MDFLDQDGPTSYGTLSTALSSASEFLDDNLLPCTMSSTQPGHLAAPAHPYLPASHGLGFRPPHRNDWWLEGSLDSSSVEQPPLLALSTIAASGSSQHGHAKGLAASRDTCDAAGDRHVVPAEHVAAVDPGEGVWDSQLMPMLVRVRGTRGATEAWVLKPPMYSSPEHCHRTGV